ncbi:hypothetical protein [Paenibacillus prosopidis]|uniref:Uncharacterized protein n=1 Tax=Paenibacillus prosopidis TaxID=630520 RepID=A0A368VQS3_9BACL|nr:hypothetical protein [Paenibacillus prosopidis]RCW44260.1 hypothetical protein DFP97_112124 [Paenibacillus prosopidis]
MENPIITAGERHNNSIPYRRPIDLFKPCECGRFESVALFKGKQHLCEKCLKGILEVELL